MRLVVRLLAASLLAALALSARAGETRISLVLICDIYDMHEEGGRGGMARVGAVVKAEKARGPNVLVAHAGDTFSPSLMSGFDQGAHMVDLLNMLPIDVFVPGNHEYDFGPDVFLKRLREARFPVYAANLRESDGSPISGIIDSRIHAFGEVKIGVIGLTAEDSHKKSQPGRLKIAPMLDTAAAQAASLRRQSADLIVLVSHSNRTIDNELVDSGVADVILSGDDHDLYLRYNGRVAIVEAAMDGLVVAVVDLSVKIDTLAGGKRKVAWWPRFRIIDTADVAPDPDVTARVAVYESRLSKSLDTVIGHTTTELDSRNAAVRGGEAAIGNLFTDALRVATGADVALLNGGGFRGNHVYPAGSAITERLVLAELPFLNRALVLEVRGRCCARRSTASPAPRTRWAASAGLRRDHPRRPHTAQRRSGRLAADRRRAGRAGQALQARHQRFPGARRRWLFSANRRARDRRPDRRAARVAPRHRPHQEARHGIGQDGEPHHRRPQARAALSHRQRKTPGLRPGVRVSGRGRKNQRL